MNPSHFCDKYFRRKGNILDLNDAKSFKNSVVHKLPYFCGGGEVTYCVIIVSKYTEDALFYSIHHINSKLTW